MAPLHRLLVALSLLLVFTGAAGVATHRSSVRAGAASASPPTSGPTARSSAPPTPPTPPAPPTATEGTTTSTAPGPAGPDAAALEPGLVTPMDMGGYYRTVPSTGAELLRSSSCLGPFGPAADQSGRAVTALLGPDEHSVPTLVEEVASYPGQSARSRFRAAAAALASCSTLSFDFGGPVVSTRLASRSIPPVGDANRVWSGRFTLGSSAFTVEIGVVLSGQEVLALIWIDSVPPSDPVMGSFISTVSLAIGKLA